MINGIDGGITYGIHFSRTGGDMLNSENYLNDVQFANYSIAGVFAEGYNCKNNVLERCGFEGSQKGQCGYKG